jgi:hypothetical protein
VLTVLLAGCSKSHLCDIQFTSLLPQDVLLE